MFRFTIRDVLWLTVVVAVAVCWWTSNRAKDQYYADELLKAQKKAERDIANLQSLADDAVFDASMIGAWIDPQAQSLPSSEKKRLWEKYGKESRLIPRFNK